jgi:lysylphosphatidylglycerol synthetase-like protein (DUF2156 family)
MSGIALLIAIVVVSYLIKNSIWNTNWLVTSSIDSARKYCSIGFFASTLITSTTTIFTANNIETSIVKSIIGIIFITMLGFLIGFLFYKLSNKSHSSNEKEDSLWETALDEIEQNNKDAATWAKAISESMGDTDKAKAIYLRKRVEALIEK